MLDSMIRSPRPTRAEVADVANAVLDCTDVLMLSGETASGRYPVLAVQMMDSIVREIEASPLYDRATESMMPRMDWDFTHACAAAAALTSRHTKLAAIVVFTREGHTANMVAEFRPRAPIVGVTARREVAQRMALQWGVIPVLHALPEVPNETLALAARIARETLPMVDGDTIGIVSGHQKDTGTKSFILHRLPAT
jgi:pyruvate kinase